MNIAYLKKDDTLYLEVSAEDPHHTWEAHPGVVLNLSQDGRLVGVELQNISEKADLSLLRVGDFPGEVHAVQGAAH